MIFDVNAWVGTWPFRSLRDNTPETLVARLDRSGIQGAAVSQIEAMFHRNVQPANEKLVESIEPYRERLVPLATINPMYAGWERDLEACHQSLGMRGVRLFPQYHDYEPDGSVARAVVSACADRGLPVFIPHRVEDIRERHWMDPGRVVELDRLANLVAACPDATIVIPNGRPIYRSALWRREELRDHSWFVDLSVAEIHYGLHKSTSSMRDLADVIEGGGAKHLLFGTHLPFSYAGPALVKRAILGVDADTLADISYRSASRILGIDLEIPA